MSIVIPVIVGLDLVLAARPRILISLFVKQLFESSPVLIARQEVQPRVD